MNTLEQLPEIMTLKETAAYFRCSERHMQNLILRGLPHFRLGSLIRFRKEEVLQFLEAIGLRTPVVSKPAKPPLAAPPVKPAAKPSVKPTAKPTPGKGLKPAHAKPPAAKPIAPVAKPAEPNVDIFVATALGMVDRVKVTVYMPVQVAHVRG